MTSDELLEHFDGSETACLRALVQDHITNWNGQTISLTSIGEAGSAGKTTAIVTFAACLAEAGATVEVMDLDGQANASVHFGIGTSERNDPEDNLLDPRREDIRPPLVVGDVLTRRLYQFPGEDSPRAVTFNDIRRSAFNADGIPGLGVIVDPSNPDYEFVKDWLNRIQIYPNGNSYIDGNKHTFYDDLEEIRAKDPAGALRLQQAVNKINTTPHFRLKDLHGTKSLIMASEMLVADRLLNCVGPDDKTTGKDLDNLLYTIQEMQEHVNDKLWLAIVLMCRLKAGNQKGRIGNKMLNRLKERHGPIVADTAVRDVVTVSEAYYNREPLPMWVPDDDVTNDFRRALIWAFAQGVFSR
jgi:cellulose biosynthesis protein BcsQ